MASSFGNRLCVLAIVLVHVFIFCCNLGKVVAQAGTDIIGDPVAGEGLEDEPHGGIGAGTGTGTGTGAGIGTGTGTGTGIGTGAGIGTGTGTGSIIGDEPAGIIAKALICFNDKYIYSSCEETYRLTETGDLHVPPGYVDTYCTGPCLTETNLVLNCIGNIMTHFEFYNKATIKDVRSTIKAGCEHGPRRGNFNIAEHLQAEENSACKSTIQFLLGFGLLILGHSVWL